MVISTELPLKPSEQAIVKFLELVVFGGKKPNSDKNRRQYLHHDVYGASKLIRHIVRKMGVGSNNFRLACNLTYGNTIVLHQQVHHLLSDAYRAHNSVSFSLAMAAEEDRRRRTREQMEKGLSDDSTTPKKKRRSKMTDDNLLVLQSPLNIALRQDITMPDALGVFQNEDFGMDDDLAPPTTEQYEMLYGVVNSENPNLDSTFLDRFSSASNQNRYQDIHNDTFEAIASRTMGDFEFERPTEDFIRNQLETPTKYHTPLDPEEELFEPHSALADILRYGRLPLGQRRSMEEEMEDNRHMGINAEFETPDRLEVPRLPSQIELDDDIIIPPHLMPPARTPRRLLLNNSTALLNHPTEDEKHRISLKEMHIMMENFSALHHSTTGPLRVKHRKGMPLRELLDTVPYFMRKHTNEDLLEMFPKKSSKHVANEGTTVSDTEEDKEEALELRETLNFEQLEPIDLSQLKFKETPLKDQGPSMSPPQAPRPYEEMEYEPIEQPRREVYEEPQFVEPMERSLNDALIDEPTRFEPSNEYSAMIGSYQSEKSVSVIRENLLRECEKVSPYSFKLDSLLTVSTDSFCSSTREAARTFYVALELLKERVITATQITPYSPIDVFIAGNDSEDLEELASNQEDSDDDFQ